MSEETAPLPPHRSLAVIRRPTSYTDALGAKICDQIADGKTLREVAASRNMPSSATIMRWVGKNPEFREMWGFALMARFDEWANELRKIAAGQPGDVAETCEDDSDKTVRVAGVKQTIQRSRLEIETMQWIMGKMLPKVYGEPAQSAAPVEVPAIAAPLATQVIVPPTHRANIIDLYDPNKKATA